MRFKDKVAVVTGGNSGMGKEAARRFVSEGGSIVVNGRNAAKTEAAVKEIDPSGKRAIASIGDIAHPSAGREAVKSAIDHFGRLDVLFNNAGIFGPKPFLEVDEAEYDRFIDGILKGSFFAAQAAAAAMRSWRIGRRNRADGLDVGFAGNWSHAFKCVLCSEGWRPRADKEPGH